MIISLIITVSISSGRQLSRVSTFGATQGAPRGGHGRAPLDTINRTNKQTYIHASPTVPCLVTTGRRPLGTRRTLKGYRFHIKPLATRLFRSVSNDSKITKFSRYLIGKSNFSFKHLTAKLCKIKCFHCEQKYRIDIKASVTFKYKIPIPIYTNIVVAACIGNTVQNREIRPAYPIYQFVFYCQFDLRPYRHETRA